MLQYKNKLRKKGHSLDILFTYSNI